MARALAPRGSCGPRLRLRSSDRSPRRLRRLASLGEGAGFFSAEFAGVGEELLAADVVAGDLRDRQLSAARAGLGVVVGAGFFEDAQGFDRVVPRPGGEIGLGEGVARLRAALVARGAESVTSVDLAGAAELAAGF